MTLKDRKSSDKLRDPLGVGVRNFIQRGRLRWFGHVERMDNWVKKCREEVVVHGHRGQRVDKDSWVKKCREIVVGHKAGGEVDRDRLVMKVYILECGIYSMMSHRVKWNFAVK